MVAEPPEHVHVGAGKTRLTYRLDPSLALVATEDCRANDEVLVNVPQLGGVIVKQASDDVRAAPADKSRAENAVYVAPDSGELGVLSGRWFVRARDEGSLDALRQELARRQIEVERILSWAPHCGWVRSELPPAELSAVFAALDLLAEPELLRHRALKPTSA